MPYFQANAELLPIQAKKTHPNPNPKLSELYGFQVQFVTYCKFTPI